MGEIVNLRRARKAKARAVAAETAAGRRALHGRTRAEGAADTAARERVARVLDGAFVGEIGASGERLPSPPAPKGEGA